MTRCNSFNLWMFARLEIGDGLEEIYHGGCHFTDMQLYCGLHADSAGSCMCHRTCLLEVRVTPLSSRHLQVKKGS